MELCLDTTMLVGLVRHSSDALAKMDAWEDSGDTLAVAEMSVFEVLAGIECSRAP